MDRGIDYALQEERNGGQGAANRNLLLALKRVYEAWFPPNPALLEKIRQGLEDGAYDLDIDFLITELKTDLALFSFCVKEVVALFKQEDLPLPHNSSPMELLRLAGTHRIKRILRTKADDISPYDLDKMSEVQAARLKEALISASASEVLAEQSNLDTETGFSSGFLRQLGLALVSWNYPNIYRRTLKSITHGRDLDQALTRELGFSPGLLGLSIARQWGASPEIRSALGDPQALAGVGAAQIVAVRRVGDALAKICEIGEALARANDPENYPDAKTDWESARKEIETRLGNEGLRHIQGKVRENCESYIKLMPEVFKSTIEIQPESRLRLQQADNLSTRNKHIKDCPSPLREKLVELYGHIDEQNISKDNIIFWAKSVVPLTGFPRGCIFLLDPETASLVPRLAVGNAELSDFKPVLCAASNSGVTRIAAAYHCNAPLIERDARTRDGNAGYIACVIGIVQRAGVLYLELSDELSQFADLEPLTYFKAVAQALSDCLNVK